MSTAGDPLEQLVRAHWRELRGLLAAMTGDLAMAEDLAQDVFCVALRKGMQPGPGARAWLRRTARYLALNAMRKSRPEPVDPADLAELAGETVAEADDSFENRLAALRECLSELRAADREVLAAKYGRGQRLAALAQTCGQTEGYLKQRLLRLRRRLWFCIARRLSLPGAGAGG